MESGLKAECQDLASSSLWQAVIAKTAETVAASLARREASKNEMQEEMIKLR